jgi:hypothetical protein
MGQDLFDGFKVQPGFPLNLPDTLSARSTR